jgi:hypothetical protein
MSDSSKVDKDLRADLQDRYIELLDSVEGLRAFVGLIHHVPEGDFHVTPTQIGYLLVPLLEKFESCVSAMDKTVTGLYPEHFTTRVAA